MSQLTAPAGAQRGLLEAALVAETGLAGPLAHAATRKSGKIGPVLIGSRGGWSFPKG